MHGERTAPGSLVRGRFVEYAPQHYVRAEQVLEVAVHGGEEARLTTLSGRVIDSPHTVDVLLQAVNLSLQQPDLNAGGA
jgi:hypothetical protein